MLRLRHILILGLMFGAACQTTPKEGEKPVIARDMDLGEAYGLAKVYGADTMQKVKDLARERKELDKLHQLAANDLVSNHRQFDFATFTHITSMYAASTTRLEPQVITALLTSNEPLARKFGWRLAAAKPSNEIAGIIDRVLNQALNTGREDELLDPDMARALQENNMKSAYTFLTRGLQMHGNPEYASAMLSLDPRQAAEPFLTYLTRADLDDLRQLNQKSVNVYTCTVIFRFLMENQLPISHPGTSSLFLFAVSRNRGLAEMANGVLEKHIPEHRASFALMLARLPVPVQVAFIENSQREMTANLRLLLMDLKEVAQQKEVIEELNAPQESGAQ